MSSGHNVAKMVVDHVSHDLVVLYIVMYERAVAYSKGAF
jgi:hypothetical protein